MGLPMKWQMSQDSLFAILLRSPWWVSGAIALALGFTAYSLLPAEYKLVGSFSAAPFVVIACIAGWRTLRAPGAKRIGRTLDAVRAMSWTDFTRAMDEGFRRDGYEVTQLDGRGADFKLSKAFRVTLVNAKRWKVARTGIEPLRDLYAARELHSAHDCIYVTIGDVSDNARKFALDKNIRLFQGADIVRLLPTAGRGR